MKTEPVDTKEKDRIKAENEDDEFQIGGKFFLWISTRIIDCFYNLPSASHHVYKTRKELVLYF